MHRLTRVVVPEPRRSWTKMSATRLVSQVRSLPVGVQGVTRLVALAVKATKVPSPLIAGVSAPVAPPKHGRRLGGRRRERWPGSRPGLLRSTR